MSLSVTQQNQKLQACHIFEVLPPSPDSVLFQLMEFKAIWSIIQKSMTLMYQVHSKHNEGQGNNQLNLAQVDAKQSL